MKKQFDSIVLMPFPRAVDAKTAVQRILSCPIGEKVIPFSSEYKDLLNGNADAGLQCYCHISGPDDFLPDVFDGIRIPLSLHFRYSQAAFRKLLPALMELSPETRRNTTVFLDDCEWEEVIETRDLNDFLKHFSTVVLTYDFRDGRMPKTYRSLCRKKTLDMRRRPCRYPFESLYVDKRLNVYKCPFSSSGKLFRAEEVNDIRNDRRYLMFLASQLSGELSLSAECRECPYWLDGWLADETRIHHSRDGGDYRILFQRHGCIISRSRDI